MGYCHAPMRIVAGPEPLGVVELADGAGLVELLRLLVAERAHALAAHLEDAGPIPPAPGSGRGPRRCRAPSASRSTTALPARRASTEIGWCQWSGVPTMTASTSSRASTSRWSRLVKISPCRSRAASRRPSKMSQAATSSTPGMRSAVPTPAIPIPPAPDHREADPVGGGDLARERLPGPFAGHRPPFAEEGGRGGRGHRRPGGDGPEEPPPAAGGCSGAGFSCFAHGERLRGIGGAA